MVVESTVPTTTTSVPVVMAVAEVEAVPFRYVVEDASLTVTFWPAPVVRVKPDEVTLSTVPDAPPSAGPDLALDDPPLAPPVVPAPAVAPPPAAGKCPVGAEADAVDVMASETESPITAHISAAAAIQPLLLFASTRRSLAQRPSLGSPGADGSGEAPGG